MKYKFLLLDIDGTLTTPKEKALPSQKIIEAVKRAQEHATVAIATGRPKNLAQPVINALNLHGYGIFNGGSEIINTVTQHVEFKQLLSVGQLHEIIKLAVPFGYPVFVDTDQYGRSLQSHQEVTVPAVKVFIEAVKNKDVPAILAALGSVPAVAPHPTVSWTDGEVMDIHVTHELATKRHGAEQLTRMLGYKKSQVIAVGDGYNDVPLLEAAGLKVAMGNAPDEVKAIADYIAPSLTDDGVADVIERFILT